jgi:hypothetical protein
MSMPTEKKPVRKSTKGASKRTPSTTTSKRKARIKKLRLTQAELRLLQYPPTETTWICKCGKYGSGEAKLCYFCNGKKTKTLLWPKYVEACTKVGIEPGSMWKIVDVGYGKSAMTRVPKGTWREIPVPEGYTL